jgi:hypothetical protein
MVANVNNPSATESIKVAVVFVQGKGEKEERSYRLDRELKPLDSMPVGWSELGGWKLKHGDKLRIRCDGYSTDLACEVADCPEARGIERLFHHQGTKTPSKANFLNGVLDFGT